MRPLGNKCLQIVRLQSHSQIQSYQALGRSWHVTCPIYSIDDISVKKIVAVRTERVPIETHAAPNDLPQLHNLMHNVVHVTS